MKNLIGTNLTLTVPFSMPEKVGKIDDVGIFKKFLEEHLGEYLGEDDKIEAFIGYAIKFPIVVEAMIEKDFIFKDALKYADENVQERMDELNNAIADMADSIELEGFITSLIDILKDYLKSNKKSFDEQKIVACNINNLSYEFVTKIFELGLVKKAKEIASNDLVVDIINNTEIKLFREILEESLEKFKSKISDLELTIIKSVLFSQLDDKYIEVTLSALVSLSVIKAIEENKKVSEVADNIGFEDVLEKLKYESKLSNAEDKKQIYEKVIEFALNMLVEQIK